MSVCMEYTLNRAVRNAMCCAPSQGLCISTAPAQAIAGAFHKNLPPVEEIPAINSAPPFLYMAIIWLAGHLMTIH